jgi:biotin carboxylase
MKETQKKILFLGGSFFQIPPIKYAKQQGYYIITCDYLPGNPGHQFADEYYNISTTNAEAVLDLAKRLKIDGVVVFASDVAATTAAFIAEKLNLPGNPYRAVEILARKDLFRSFLRENNFNVPHFACFNSIEDVQYYYHNTGQPFMLKPVDSSGSKGVSKITEFHQIPDAFNLALSFSRVKKVIVEEFINKKGTQIAGDGFVLNGKLVFRCFGQEHFNKTGNPFVPVGESFPLLLPDDIQNKIHAEIERLMTLLKMRGGALNFDIMIDENHNIYLMEIGPRSGGNLISEVINYSTGVDLAKYVVDFAMGADCSSLKMYTTANYHSCYILNSKQTGYFRDITLHESISNNVIEQIVLAKSNDIISSFENSGCTVGILILKFSSAEEMIEKMSSMQDRYTINFLN